MFKCEDICEAAGENLCCYSCSMKGECSTHCEQSPESCGISVEIPDETGVELFQQTSAAVIQTITKIVVAKKALDDQEKQLKEALKAAMEKHGIKKFTSDKLNITYVAATTQNSVDSKRLKEEKPEVYAAFTKTSNKSAYVKVELK